MAVAMHKPGLLAIMGSGELSDSMAEVHRILMARLKGPILPAFIDTPAGFELNVEGIVQKARAYFDRNFGCELAISHLRRQPRFRCYSSQHHSSGELHLCWAGKSQLRDSIVAEQQSLGSAADSLAGRGHAGLFERCCCRDRSACDPGLRNL